MDVTRYPPPVDKLLTLGDGRKVGTNPKEWSIYPDLGLGPEHIPDLIRMATDEELRWAYSDTLEVWAPIHAWRALGQLRAEDAIELLLSLFEESEDDEWVIEELPEVYGIIGPVAIPALTAYLVDNSHLDEARITASNCLEKIGMMHPEVRTECVTVLSRQLESYKENGPDLNASLIRDLIDLKALEAASLIEQAFAADCVDLSLAGDWDDVRIELGLNTRKEILKEQYSAVLNPGSQSSISHEEIDKPLFSLPKTSRTQTVTHKKVKQKMANQSRKKNRKGK